MNYRLQVIAPTSADAVAHAGGWLFDHGTAGWKVQAILMRDSDPRPLQILGAEVADPNAAAGEPDDLPGMVVTTADLYPDPRVQTLIRVAHAEVLVWDHVPVSGPRTLSHRPGAAARAFKAQALIAAGLGTIPGGSVETFRIATGRRAARGTVVESLAVLSQG